MPGAHAAPGLVDGPLTNDVFAYTYDELGRVVSRTLNGVTTTWSYDAQGRLTTLGDPIGNFTYGYVGSTGRVSSVTSPNGQTTSYAYLPVNQDLRLQEIHHKKPGGLTLNKFNYTYDVVGNILTWAQQTDTNPAQTYTYEYDRADPLTAATLVAATPKRYRYAYDPAGNRTVEQIDDAATLSTHDNMNRLTTQVPGGGLVFRGTVSEPATVSVGGQPATVSGSNQFSGTAQVPSGTSQVTVQAVDPSGNVRTNVYELTQTGATKSFTYDPNGNLTGDGTKTYEWDAENRLTAVKQGGNTVASFSYDGIGRRATKASGGVTTTYVYAGRNLVEERPSAGATKRKVYGPRTDESIAQVASGAVTYNVADHLGSIVRTSDTAGNPTLTREYDPWGNAIQGSATSGSAFTGRDWDAETALYYYRAEYYDPTLGRFLSEDPLGPAVIQGLYLYVGNKPVILRDPTGLIEMDPHGEIVVYRGVPILNDQGIFNPTGKPWITFECKQCGGGWTPQFTIHFSYYMKYPTCCPSVEAEERSHLAGYEAALREWAAPCEKAEGASYPSELACNGAASRAVSETKARPIPPWGEETHGPVDWIWKQLRRVIF